MKTKIAEWAIELGKRAQAKPTPVTVPEGCSACHSKNVFAGSGSVKCRDCGQITEFLNRERDNGMHLDIIEELYKNQSEFLKEHRGR
jgi:hypothetical protein